MYLTIFKINHNSYQTAKVWVKTNNAKTALQQSQKRLNQEHVKVIDIVETVKTEREDYFLPCTSLDTFERAEKEGIAILLS